MQDAKFKMQKGDARARKRAVAQERRAFHFAFCILNFALP
jgi:hypothetical protein